MERHFSICRFAVAAVLAGLTATAAAQQAGPRITVPFSDPSRPGTVRINLLAGSVTVHGTNRHDVSVSAQDRGDPRASARPGPAPSGLHRLTQVPSFEAQEDNDVISISGSSPNRSLDLDVEVPARTSLHVSTVNNGSITVDGVEGELEIRNVNGPITLTNVAGSVVAHTVNGPLMATLVRVAAQKPMAFSSFNGNVDVTLPAGTKANLKLRSDQGEVFTDFDVDLKTTAAAPVEGRDQRGKFRIEVNRSIYGAINGGGPDFELRTFNGNIYVRKGN
jgi:hypothetical protein